MNKFYSIYDAEIDVTRHTASKSLAEKIFTTRNNSSGMGQTVLVRKS